MERLSNGDRSVEGGDQEPRTDRFDRGGFGWGLKDRREVSNGIDDAF